MISSSRIVIAFQRLGEINGEKNRRRNFEIIQTLSQSNAFLGRVRVRISVRLHMHITIVGARTSFPCKSYIKHVVAKQAISLSKLVSNKIS